MGGGSGSFLPSPQGPWDGEMECVKLILLYIHYVASFKMLISLPSWLAKSAVHLDVAGSARLIVQLVSFPNDNKMYYYHKSSSTCLKTCSFSGNYCLPSQKCLSLVLITGYEVEGLRRPRMVNEESQSIM